MATLPMARLAMLTWFGVTGVLLYMFTHENQKHYAVLKALGASPRTLVTMVLMQTAVCALLGVGLSFVVEGSRAPASLRADVLLPYAAAVAGALLWTMPPRVRQGLSTDV